MKQLLLTFLLLSSISLFAQETTTKKKLSSSKQLNSIKQPKKVKSANKKMAYLAKNDTIRVSRKTVQNKKTQLKIADSLLCRIKN